MIEGCGARDGGWWWRGGGLVLLPRYQGITSAAPSHLIDSLTRSNQTCTRTRARTHTHAGFSALTSQCAALAAPHNDNVKRQRRVREHSGI